MTASRSQPPPTITTTVPPHEMEHGLVAPSAFFPTDGTPVKVGARIPIPGGTIVFLGRTGDGQHVFMDAEDFDAGPNPQRRSRRLIRRRAAPDSEAWHMDVPADWRRTRRSRWVRVR